MLVLKVYLAFNGLRLSLENIRAMKKIILSIALFLCVTFLSAQTEKGNRLLGGNFNIGVQLIENDDDLYFVNLNLQYGKFLNNNFAGGVEIGTSFNKWGYDNITSLSLMPFIKGYFGNGTKTRAFVELGFEGLTFLESYKFQNNLEFGLMIKGGPGVAVFINKNISIDVKLNFVRRVDANIVDIYLFDFFQQYIGGFVGFQLILDPKED